jgi:hypothetical protein
METTALDIKFLMFLALELSVLFVVVAGVVAGVYQVVRDTVREAHRKAGLTSEAS